MGKTRRRWLLMGGKVAGGDGKSPAWCHMEYFFSYAREDSAFVLEVAKAIRAAGAQAWLDQRDIPAGELWDHVVQKALDSCAVVILVLSPQSVRSKNVMDEVSYALERNKRIVPIPSVDT